MFSRLSLPVRATFIAFCAALGLMLLCGCAKTLAPMSVVPAPSMEIVQDRPQNENVTAANNVDHLFEQALVERATRTVRPSFRNAFAPSL